MKLLFQIVVVVLTTICSLHVTNGASILGIYHYTSQSHHMLGSTLLQELARKGHHVTMLSPYPLKNPPDNYTDIALPELRDYKEEMDIFKLTKGGVYEKSMKLYQTGLKATNITIHSAGVKKLINDPHAQFDLVIIECFLNEALLAIAHHFQAPVISMSTTGTVITNTYITDNPTPYAYVPNMDVGYTDKMNFMERVRNVIISFFSDVMVQYVMPLDQNQIMKQVFPDTPHVRELTKNISLVLLNSHYSIETPRPLVPQMIQIGGFHVKEPKKLPEELQKFLDTAKEGVVFFSLGSNIKSSNLPPEKLKAILNTFGKLKQKVLFKWEDEQLQDKPDNVKIGRWLPQNDILANRNVKAFVTHGGLLSTIEAVHHGVPLVGIPLFGDQRYNVHVSAKVGYAVPLDFNELTETTLEAALNEVLYNAKYRQTIERKSRLLRDQPVKPLDNAVFWVEHVLRQKGAEHLRTAAQHLCWGQMLLLDVLAFLILCGVIILFAVYLVIKTFMCTCKCITRCIVRKICSGKCCVSKCVFGKLCNKENANTASTKQIVKTDLGKVEKKKKKKTKTQ